MARVTREKSPASIRFKIMRKHLELTQVELAKILGRHQTTIAGFESGKYDVHPDDFRVINKKFGISYDWFYNGTGKMFSGAQENKTTLIKDVATLNNSNEELAARLQRVEKKLASTEERITELMEKYKALLLQKVGT